MAIGRRDVETVIARLRANPDLRPRELERVYRRLILQVHPDHHEDGGELFLFLRSEFDRLRAERKRNDTIAMLENDLDPHRLAGDLGITRVLSPRESLYVALYRFRSLGLSSWRVLVRPSLRERNNRVIRTILYWGRRYDESFVPAFQDFLRYPGQFLLAENQAPLYFLVRRTMLRGLDWLIVFQDRGRPATADLAGDTLRYALSIASGRERDTTFAALLGMTRWMLAELDLPCLKLHIDA